MKMKRNGQWLLMLVGIVSVFFFSTALPAAKNTATETTSETKTETPDKPVKTRAQTAAEKYGNYLVEMFSEHLNKGDWIARSMAVISLSRIDDPRVTETLFNVVKRDRKPIVRVFAWEALHARQNKLTPEQRERWKKDGFSLDDKGYIRGEMRLTIVKLMEEDGPTTKSKNRFKKIFDQTNSLKSSDILVIHALGDILKKWKSPDLVRTLINKLSDRFISQAYRAELVLQRLVPKDTIPLATHFLRNRKTSLESSNAWWSYTQKLWKDWFKENQKEYKQISSQDTKPYAGVSKIMPKPLPITESNYKAWQSDLELRKFQLNQLDIQFVLDTTASMSRAMEWLQHDLGKMMLAFELISREPRVGLTCYRDRGDKYIAKNAPLTSKVDLLIKYLAKEEARGGGADIPEAVYEGLYLGIKKQDWSNSIGGRQIVVLIGDAPPQKNSMDKIETLVKEAAKNGFIVNTIKVDLSDWYKKGLKDDYDPDLKTFDKIAQWGNGSSAGVDFNATVPFLNPKSPTYAFRWTRTAQPNANAMAERIIFKETLKACLTEDYRDRVGPFVTILLEFCDAKTKEYRKPFPKREPGTSTPHRNRQLDR